MPKTIRNEFYKCLTYEKLLKAHNLSQKGKTSKNEIILFNMKKEENLNWLCEALKASTYEHGPYRTFYVNIERLNQQDTLIELYIGGLLTIS